MLVISIIMLLLSIFVVPLTIVSLMEIYYETKEYAIKQKEINKEED